MVWYEGVGGGVSEDMRGEGAVLKDRCVDRDGWRGLWGLFFGGWSRRWMRGMDEGCMREWRKGVE